jgi:hypothetical protein
LGTVVFIDKRKNRLAIDRNRLHATTENGLEFLQVAEVGGILHGDFESAGIVDVERQG